MFNNKRPPVIIDNGALDQRNTARSLLVDRFGLGIGEELYKWYSASNFGTWYLPIDRDIFAHYLVNSDALLELVPSPGTSKGIKTGIVGGSEIRDALVASVIVSVATVGFLEDESRQKNAIDAALAIDGWSSWEVLQNPLPHVGHLASLIKRLDVYTDVLKMNFWDDVFEPFLNSVKISGMLGSLGDTIVLGELLMRCIDNTERCLRTGVADQAILEIQKFGAYIRTPVNYLRLD